MRDEKRNNAGGLAALDQRCDVSKPGLMRIVVVDANFFINCRVPADEVVDQHAVFPTLACRQTNAQYTCLSNTLCHALLSTRGAVLRLMQGSLDCRQYPRPLCSEVAHHLSNDAVGMPFRYDGVS